MRARKLGALALTASLLVSCLPLGAAAAGKRTPEALLAGMTTEEKVSQMLMPALRYYADEDGKLQGMTELTADHKALLERHGFAGVVLFAQNAVDTTKAVELVDSMQKANAAGTGRTQLLMAIDQEGGSVTRLGHGTQMPGNMALGAAGDPDLAAQAGEIIGSEIMSMGINFNFAPVLDVNNNPANPVIGTRSFSDDPSLVAELGVSYMTALQATGAISTLKHFPGHGDTGTDSHTGLPRIDKSYEELKACELVPFAAAIEAGADAVMTAHIQYPQIEKTTYTSKLTGEGISLPATLSQTILTDILRGDLGFEGVVVTDAMNMDAIAKHFDPLDAAKLAIEAGVDIILMPVDVSTKEGIDALEDYIDNLTAMVDKGEISKVKVDAAVLRVLELKESHGLLEPYTPVAAGAETFVGSAANHAREWALTKKTVTLVKNDHDMLPLTGENEKIAVLTAYNNEVLSMEYAIGLLQEEGKLAQGTTIMVNSLQGKTLEDALVYAEGADHVVVISELYSAAGLKGNYATLVDDLIAAVHADGGDVAVLSCSLPYDAARYPDADAIALCWSAKGMSEDPRITDGAVAQYGPSMPAALYLMLSPDEGPTGRLPVNIPALNEDFTYSPATLYRKGFGLTYTSALSAFTDLVPGAWYEEGVSYVVKQGIMEGMGGGIFAPDREMTRAEMVTTLWRMAGKPAAQTTASFADVLPETWYTDAVSWAAASGVVYGYGGAETGTFGVNDPVTREQLCAILMRYAGVEDQGGAMGLAGYDDATEISDWARPAMLWAVINDIMTIREGGKLAPRAAATRAELAQALCLFQKV